MRTRLKALLTTVLLGSSAVVAAGLPAAQASTGGVEDRANRYSAVALIAFYDGTGRYRCTATLVSPTVLLTAAHCTDGTLGKTAVTFQPVLAEMAPSGLPTASDPAAGYTSADITKAPGYVAGTASTHPDYSGFTDLATWNDTAVVVLDEPVTGITPMEIAPVGTLDAIAKGDLRKTLFRAVGYGTEVRKSEEGPQKPTPQSFPLVRRYVDMPGQKLQPQVIQTNGNENDQFGTGGTCFGDSGGPLLLDEKIVGVTSYGLTANCRYIDGYQRIDIVESQEWLAQFGL